MSDDRRIPAPEMLRYRRMFWWLLSKPTIDEMAPTLRCIINLGAEDGCDWEDYLQQLVDAYGVTLEVLRTKLFSNKVIGAKA